MPRKPFQPKSLNPGAPITWAHICGDGIETVRTGIVWSLGPIVRGNCASVWVSPDVRSNDDAYPAAVLVVVPHKTANVYTGRVWHGAWEACGGRRVKPGEAFSETYPYSRTGAEAQSAARLART
jgi:hypothetical protein